jgi:hypothetical protein
LKPFATGTTEVPRKIVGYKERHTDTTVRFVVEIDQVTSSATCELQS